MKSMDLETQFAPTLTFTDGRFVFKNASQPQRKALNKSEYWTCAALDSYETTSLRAAAALRRHSDSVAERVFNRAFQAHYDLPVGLPLPSFLDPHQREGVKWVLARKRSYLAHAPGAGKTWEATVAAVMAQGTGQVLLVVPPTMTVNWQREILRITELLGEWASVAVVPPSARKQDMAWRADFIICPDSMLSKPWVYTRLAKMKKKLVAVDEASRFKDPYAERSIVFYGGRTKDQDFPGLYQDARHVVFLDGSPLLNRPMELWAPTFALHPEAIDCLSQDDFGYRYCGPKITDRGQYTFLRSSNEDELRGKLQKDFMHVVTEESLEHPERRRSMLFMSEDVRSPEHKSWERRHLSNLVMSDLSDEDSRGEMARFRKELGVRKVPWIARYVRDRLTEKGESVLLFVWHREVAESLTLELVEFDPGLVMGGTHPKERERFFQDFQSGRRKLIVGNIAAMGRGHNLQRADRVIFGEFSWTDELNKQCEKRASRRGSEKDFVRCDYIVCPNSMDEPVLRSVFTKMNRVKRIIG